MSSLIQEKKPEDILPILETFFESKKKVIDKELIETQKKVTKEMALAQLEAGYMMLVSDKEKIKIESSVKESKKRLWGQALKKANGDKKKAISFYAQTCGQI